MVKKISSILFLSLLLAAYFIVLDKAQIQLTPGFSFYLFGLFLPGIAAHVYCQLKKMELLKMSKGKAVEGYYRLGSRLSFFSLVYVAWFLAGLNIVGETDIVTAIFQSVWSIERDLGFSGKPRTSLYFFSVFILIFIPYMVGGLLIKTAPYHLDKILRKTTWSLSHFLWLAVRGQIVFIVPMIIWASLSPFVPDGTLAYLICIFIYGFLLYAFSPLLLRFIWTSKPLDSPEMSKRIQRLCRKAGIRVREVRVLETSSGKVANAMVSGLFPFYRYIFFTDYFLTHFSSEETETVLAHEIGHIKKGHLWFNLGLVFIWIVASHFVYKGVEPIFKAAGLSMIYFYLIWIFLFLGVITKFVSRRFERQADIYSVELTGELETYISALTKLTEINFSTKKWTGFDRLLKTHPDLEGRIKNLREMGNRT
jgi:STE24 endopeptidase